MTSRASVARSLVASGGPSSRTALLMAPSGLRSSWPSIARNSSLARLACWASSNIAARSRSRRLRALTSRTILEAPITRPCESLTGDTVSEMSTSEPSLRRRTVSKWSTASPARTRASTMSSSARRS